MLYDDESSVTFVSLKETELCKLRIIITQSAFERLRLEKTVAQNNLQIVSIIVKLFLNIL